MTTTLANLSEQQVKNFSRSSVYQFGDSTSFIIPLSDTLWLPGKTNPGTYLNFMGVPKEISGTVGVVCPANGGLVTELARRGAKKVITFEPRPRFMAGLKGVLELFSRVNDTPIEVRNCWPTDEFSNECDLIVWSEGLDESNSPERHLTAILASLTKDGSLYMEVTHGSQDFPQTRINSWRPTSDAFERLIAEINDGNNPEKLSQGRAQNTQFWRVDNSVLVILDEEDVKPKAPKKKPAAKKAPAKKAPAKKKAAKKAKKAPAKKKAAPKKDPAKKAAKKAAPKTPPAMVLPTAAPPPPKDAKLEDLIQPNLPGVPTITAAPKNPQVVRGPGASISGTPGVMNAGQQAKGKPEKAATAKKGPTRNAGHPPSNVEDHVDGPRVIGGVSSSALTESNTVSRPTIPVGLDGKIMKVSKLLGITVQAVKLEVSVFGESYLDEVLDNPPQS